MERKEMSALDIMFLARELRQGLAGGVVRKIYQYGKKELMIEVYKGSASWFYADSEKAFLTRRKRVSPQEPPSFCMFLRKHLMGKRVQDVRQHGFDRILELVFEDAVLVLEMVPPGNVVLRDTQGRIIMPLEIQKWKDRTVRPKEAYVYPPSRHDPFAMDMDSLIRIMRGSDKSLGGFVASTLSLGPAYSSEVCRRAGLDPGLRVSEAGMAEASALHTALAGMQNEPVPCLYSDGAYPIRMLSKDEDPQRMESFSDALDEYHSGRMEKEVKETAEAEAEEKKEEVQRILQRQDQAKGKWDRIEKESRESAELIYKNYPIVESVLNGIRKARDSGMEWPEIKERILSEGTPEADAIKEIREGDCVVVVDIGKEVELDFRKSPEENAAALYEDSKWARKKLGRTEVAMELQEKKLEEPAETESQEVFSKVRERQPKKRRGRWYQRYKWFISSDGLVVVAGRSAETNETIVKKYAENGDMVFHADIRGAAFVVIKSGGKEIPDETMKEASEFSAANSKAWAKGMGTVDVFAVRPEQLSKASPEGINLPKGSFYVSGERAWFKDREIKLAVGVKIEETEDEDGRPMRQALVLSGPVLAMRKNTQYFITIQPGFKKSIELSEDIRKKLLIRASPEDKPLIEAVDRDDFVKAIPSGMGDIVEYG